MVTDTSEESATITTVVII